MIVGIGTDITCISRVKECIEKYGESFISKVLTPREIEGFNNRIDNHPYLAGRWAAKEAFSKAIGSGIGPEFGWQDCEIINNANGAPSFRFYGNANNVLRRFGVKQTHVSISHDTDYATATVILEQ